MLIKKSFIELRARERAKALLDSGSFRELLGPFDFIESPWLEKQNIVPQADDGMVIAKGTFGGKACCVAAIEGAFQGGSMGEVSGAKMAAMLEFALEDAEAGNPPLVVLCLETGGVRLQEAKPLPIFIQPLPSCAVIRQLLASSRERLVASAACRLLQGFAPTWS